MVLEFKSVANSRNRVALASEGPVVTAWRVLTTANRERSREIKVGYGI